MVTVNFTESEAMTVTTAIIKLAADLPEKQDECRMLYIKIREAFVKG